MLDFDFSAAREGLRGLPVEAIASGEVEESDLLVFGEQDFAEGGGARPWLCVRRRDGWVLGVDLEREESTFVLNASIDRFIATFRILDEYLGSGKELPSGLESRLRAIDPEAYPTSDWRLLVEHLRGA